MKLLWLILRALAGWFFAVMTAIDPDRSGAYAFMVFMIMVGNWKAVTAPLRNMGLLRQQSAA